MNWLPGYNYILASKSPRRQELLHELGINFSVEILDVDESYPESLFREEIPVFLAELKAKPFAGKLDKNDLLITADTIVWLNGEVFGKPANKQDAINILQKLSDNEHQVISGVCLTSAQKQKTFFSVSNVRFKKLSDSEINHYIDEYKPYDKAGAYGIQEWIGYIGITHIEGSFFNVMGLPVQQLYTEIQQF
ncbi:MAG TPA: septum formation protein Maf [Prolixibacteraceae bacterium]|nr:septum formation protein Maf [Prolixibacteraceae bacterium]